MTSPSLIFDTRLVLGRWCLWEPWGAHITYYHSAKTELFLLIQIKWLIFSKIGGSWGKVRRSCNGMNPRGNKRAHHSVRSLADASTFCQKKGWAPACKHAWLPPPSYAQGGPGELPSRVQYSFPTAQGEIICKTPSRASYLRIKKSFPSVMKIPRTPWRRTR